MYILAHWVTVFWGLFNSSSTFKFPYGSFPFRLKNFLLYFFLVYFAVTICFSLCLSLKWFYNVYICQKYFSGSRFLHWKLFLSAVQRYNNTVSWLPFPDENTAVILLMHLNNIIILLCFVWVSDLFSVFDYPQSHYDLPNVCVFLIYPVWNK